ncbi:Rpn family recombination-promoting nuclease/putative transposase [Sporosarcina trichiuri]|uniref:Rpn family recombination-promoting nuclease/putative transposase n=1 Tax=Sporosarcina trichiuri TaxID=3056445 RepID=UPI0025B2C0C2|nr:Rpn family recombination-promoting nuclease/putative transposase [Sporosarcina sp. 0.2-SM1T-5]WJY26389.1 Rpn family recombination-promoting nuclease/putative transposase [Sporosarcina sp. 0.2-SM1T-5]
MKIQNPHDKFFKEILGNVTVAKDFLHHYLPQNIMQVIDVNTLEPHKDSFINEDLQESFSDLLFKVDINQKEGFIYFLFEHKSYSSKETAFQLLKYMIEIWEAKMKKEEANELPMIIPLVIYHGKNNWNVKTQLGDMIKGYHKLPSDIQGYIPNFEYLMYDITRYSDEEIKGHAQLRILLTIFRDIFTKDSNGLRESIHQSVSYLRELEDKQTGLEYLETLMRYIFSAGKNLTRKDMYKIIEQIDTTYPEGSEIAMTLADMFRGEGKEEGILKGIERGLELGAKQGKLEVARNALKEGMQIDVIANLTGLSKREIEKIAEEMQN